jgi:hypothetical protein
MRIPVRRGLRGMATSTALNATSAARRAVDQATKKINALCPEAGAEV